MGLRGTTTTSLPASWNYWNKSLLIDSIIVSQQTQETWKRTYLNLMKLIMKALCLPVETSTIPVILLAIQRSAIYRTSLSLLLQPLLLAIGLQMKFNWREGDIIGRKGVTSIGGYLMERYV